MKEKGKTGRGSGDKGLRPLSGGLLCDFPGGCQPSAQHILTLPHPPLPERVDFLPTETHLSIFKPIHSSPQESANPVPHSLTL